MIEHGLSQMDEVRKRLACFIFHKLLFPCGEYISSRPQILIGPRSECVVSTMGNVQMKSDANRC